MKPEAQRMEIAKFLGWIEHQKNGVHYWTAPFTGNPKHRVTRRKLPQLTLDLMWEAEEKIRTHQGGLQMGPGAWTSNPWASYRANLNHLLGGSWTCAVEAEIFHATAAQRAETLLKLIGKWEATPHQKGKSK